MNQKPTFTEEEIEELNDLYGNWGYMWAIGDIQTYLKTLGYSDVNAIVIAIRKEFENKRLKERNDKFREKYKDSTLNKKLSERIDWTHANKKD
jgi:dephospho-CoA kinase